MRYKLILIFILFLASILRFYGIKEKGLVQHDEGSYLQGVKTITITLDWAIKNLFAIKQPQLKDLFYEKDGGYYPSSAKPGFYSLMALPSLFVGIHDYAAIIVSGICDVLTTLVVFFIGKELWNPFFGLLSCFIYSILGLSILYSRSALPVSPATLFMILGCLFWLYSMRKPTKRNIYLIISGFSIGYGVTCHYSYFFVPLIFLFLEFIYLIKSRLKFRKLLIFGFSMTIPLLIFQAISLLAKYIIYARGFEKYISVLGSRFTYFGQLLIQTNLGEAHSPSEIFSLFLKRVIRRLTRYHIKFEDTFSQPMGPSGVPPELEGSGLFYYINLLVAHDGWLFVFLLVLGIIAFLINIKRLSFKELSIFLLFFIPTFFWAVICPIKYARVFSVTYPFIVLIISFGLGKLFYKKKALLFLSIILIVGNAIFYIPKTMRMRSGYKSAIEWMKAHKGVKHISLTPVSDFYGGSKNARFLNSIDEAKIAYSEGFHYLLLDRNKYHFSENILIKASNTIKPVVLIPHSNDCFAYEEGFSPAIIKRILKEPRVLKIYDLGEILKSIE
ncbi:MAG: glycosyltransferase family 39 protein [bacterium]